MWAFADLLLAPASKILDCWFEVLANAMALQPSSTGSFPAFFWQISPTGVLAAAVYYFRWWYNSPRLGKIIYMRKNAAADEIPSAIIVPGLTSDSYNHYVKYVARSLSDKGWQVLVANHRGLGGVSITSDQFYNAGWTEDLRKIILLVQQTYPKSPLLAVGTSIGANILVKYLGEEGPRTPLGGAVAICCPWDLLLCDRIISRIGVQSIYNKALTIGLLQYAQLHQTARMVDWDFLRKAASIRDFDDNCTRHVGKYETVDTYYRRCSSTQFAESIAVPSLYKRGGRSYMY